MRPTHGVRYAVERDEGEGDVVRYRGFVHLPDRDLPLEVCLERSAGKATASIAPTVDHPREVVAALEQAAARLVRSATKAGALPRKIVRWREPGAS